MPFGLEGIKIVQTAQAFAGPMSGRLLADWGADVIWVEHPARGDLSRSLLDRHGRKAIMNKIDCNAENNNHNKRGITLDLTKENAREILYQLLLYMFRKCIREEKDGKSLARAYPCRHA